MAERLKGRKTLNDIWQGFRQEWRRNAAIMKTRGFWSVQLVWFVAGGIFFRLLPARQQGESWLHYALSVALICAIVLPIYFCELLTWSKWVERLLNKFRKQKP
ncbi:hypothetical protein SAMN04487996_1045 [Dyadobacter soli]|uniref:Uncharacterized protein n=1 Tax=Dyadobacter soli TaxID=659014 RepID=A0A1G7AXC4_9BACT|nr:hypothetical protein [Dyadobacter soli]SDE19544.1 hypothetical protein SAMN04487996_1045 [Dyadobacter soli]